jgi:hypothetical protein
MSAWSSSPKRKKARAMLAATLPTPCAKCGRPVESWMPWDVGHRIPTIIAPELMDDPDSWQVEHAWCNRREGQLLSSQRRPRRRISPTSRDW